MPKLTPFPRGASQHTPRSEFGKCQKDSNYKAWRPDQLRILKSWTSSCLLGCCRVGHAIAFLPKVKYMIGHGKGDTVRRECGITRSILITLGTGIGSAFAVTGNWFRTRNWATWKSMATTLKATPHHCPGKNRHVVDRIQRRAAALLLPHRVLVLPELVTVGGGISQRALTMMDSSCNVKKTAAAAHESGARPSERLVTAPGGLHTG